MWIGSCDNQLQSSYALDRTPILVRMMWWLWLCCSFLLWRPSVTFQSASITTTRWVQRSSSVTTNYAPEARLRPRATRRQQQDNHNNVRRRTRRKLIALSAAANNDEFWSQQKALAVEMDQSVSKSLKQQQMEKFKQKRLALVYDTAYISTLVFAMIWFCSSDPWTALSYIPGAVLGLAYSYGLGKSVEKIGASPLDLMDADQDQPGGSGLGEARFAFLILLFLLLGKFQSEGLQPLPAIAGFFTYQLASLKQGLQQELD